MKWRGVMVGVHSAFRNKSLFCMDGFRIQSELSVFSQRRLSEWNLVCSNLQDKKKHEMKKKVVVGHTYTDI